MQYLNNAKTNINSAKGSYKNNFKGNAANAKISSFDNCVGEIVKISGDLSKIKQEAIDLYNKLTIEINDNIKIIGTYNTKISQLDKEIDQLRDEIRHLKDKL